MTERDDRRRYFALSFSGILSGVLGLLALLFLTRLATSVLITLLVGAILFSLRKLRARSHFSSLVLPILFVCGGALSLSIGFVTIIPQWLLVISAAILMVGGGDLTVRSSDLLLSLGAEFSHTLWARAKTFSLLFAVALCIVSIEVLGRVHPHELSDDIPAVQGIGEPDALDVPDSEVGSTGWTHRGFVTQGTIDSKLDICEQHAISEEHHHVMLEALTPYVHVDSTASIGLLVTADRPTMNTAILRCNVRQVTSDSISVYIERKSVWFTSPRDSIRIRGAIEREQERIFDIPYAGETYGGQHTSSDTV